MVTVERRDGVTFARDDDHLRLVEVLHRLRVLKDGGRVRGKEVLARTDADQEGGAAARANQHVGLFGEDEADAEGALHLRRGDGGHGRSSSCDSGASWEERRWGGGGATTPSDCVGASSLRYRHHAPA